MDNGHPNPNHPKPKATFAQHGVKKYCGLQTHFGETHFKTPVNELQSSLSLINSQKQLRRGLNTVLR